LKKACDLSAKDAQGGGSRYTERKRSTTKTNNKLPTIQKPTDRVRRWEMNDTYFNDKVKDVQKQNSRWVTNGIAWGEAQEDNTIIEYEKKQQRKTEAPPVSRKRTAPQGEEAQSNKRSRNSTSTSLSGVDDDE